MYTEIFTQFIRDGNGRGYILVVPDEAAAGLTPNYQMWAMMTAQPVTGAVYEGLEAIRDERADSAGSYSSLYETLLSKGAVHDEYASMNALIVFPLFYLALVLAMVAATILTIQFLNNAQKYRKQYAILYDMGVDKREMRRTLNRHFAIYYTMPVLPPILICVSFMFSLGGAFDPGIILSVGHLWAIIGIPLGLFLAIYLLYTATAVGSRL